MAYITLTDRRNFTGDHENPNVIVDYVIGAPALAVMVVDGTVGKDAYVYKKRGAMGTATHRANGASGTATAPSYTKETVILKGDSQVISIDNRDKKALSSGGSLVTLVEDQTDWAVDSVFQQLLTEILIGDSASDALEFDGIKKLATAGPNDYTPDTAIDLTGGALTEQTAINMRQLLDKLVGGLGRAVGEGAIKVLYMHHDLIATLNSIKALSKSANYSDMFGAATYEWGDALIVNPGEKVDGSHILEPDASGLTDVLGIVWGRTSAVYASTYDDVIDIVLPGTEGNGSAFVSEGGADRNGALAVMNTKSVGIIGSVKIKEV